MDPLTLALAKKWVEHEFGGLRDLIPYIDEILDSRIVDDNIDLDDPPNGYFVRIANGWALCVHEDAATYLDGTTLEYEWSFPQVYSKTPIVLASMTDTGAPLINPSNRNITCRGYGVNTTTGVVRIRTIEGESRSFSPENVKRVTMLAVGVVVS